MYQEFISDVITNEKNFLASNPINKKDVKRKKINGTYVYERFYLIDFLNIKEDYYVISSFGRVFSLYLNKELKCHIDKSMNNYKTVFLLTNDEERHKFFVHRLVALAFKPRTISDKKNNRIYVHHDNWDNEYNYTWNLRWISPLELSVIKKIQLKDDIEEAELIRVVCKLLEAKETISDIFELVDRKISKDKISKIKNRIIYTNISCDYKF